MLHTLAGKTRAFLMQSLKLSPLSGAAKHQQLKSQPTMSATLHRKRVKMSNFIGGSPVPHSPVSQLEGPACILTAMSIGRRG